MRNQTNNQITIDYKKIYVDELSVAKKEVNRWGLKLSFENRISHE